MGYRESDEKIRAYKREWYRKNREIELVRRNAPERKAKSAAYHKKRYAEDPEFRERVRIRSAIAIRGPKHAEWKQKNREKIREYDRQLYARSKKRKEQCKESAQQRRSREAEVLHDLTQEQWLGIIERQNNRCAECGRKFSSRLTPQRDHIVPITFGGVTTASNIQALCKSCNSTKHNKVDVFDVTPERLGKT